jgi:hypothetical protein
VSSLRWRKNKKAAQRVRSRERHRSRSHRSGRTRSKNPTIGEQELARSGSEFRGSSRT